MGGFVLEEEVVVGMEPTVRGGAREVPWEVEEGAGGMGMGGVGSLICLGRERDMREECGMIWFLEYARQACKADARYQQGRIKHDRTKDAKLILGSPIQTHSNHDSTRLPPEEPNCQSESSHRLVSPQIVTQ